jgi:hypothetical protein
LKPAVVRLLRSRDGVIIYELHFSLVRSFFADAVLSFVVPALLNSLYRIEFSKIHFKISGRLSNENRAGGASL